MDFGFLPFILMNACVLVERPTASHDEMNYCESCFISRSNVTALKQWQNGDVYIFDSLISKLGVK